MTSWALETDRADLTSTRLVDLPAPQCADGEAVLRVDRVGLTANNVTYAVLGEAYRYWEFFPASDPSYGRVPLWGFADVAESKAAGVEVGQRFYGYLPPADSLVVRPERIDGRGFRDASEHRAQLPPPYNAYALTTGDAAYEPGREDLQVLYRPLFFTSFLLADQLADGGVAGARTVLFSSASSKTAYGAAFALQHSAPDLERVGLTSPGNREFTEALGCYDRVLAYDEISTLGADVPTAYVDLAGSTPLRQALHDHLTDALVLDLVVGVTHQDPTAGPGTLAGARPTVFFAPDRMGTRAADWGREGLDDRFGQAWQQFAPMAESNVDIVVSRGAKALQRVWGEMIAGSSRPSDGHVLQL